MDFCFHHWFLNLFLIEIIFRPPSHGQSFPMQRFIMSKFLSEYQRINKNINNRQKSSNQFVHQYHVQFHVSVLYRGRNGNHIYKWYITM